MANDWSTPTNSSLYTAVLGILRDQLASLAKMDFTGDSNLPTLTVALDTTATQYFKYWTGAAWANVELDAEKNLVNSSIDYNKLKDSAVRESKIQDGAVATAKVASDAVTTAKFRGVNGAWLRWRNAANSADIETLVVTNSDHTRLNADAGKELQLGIATSARWKLDGADTTNYPLLPIANNSYSIGNASFRVKRVHIGTGIEMPYYTPSPAGTTQGGATELSAPGFHRVASVTSSAAGVKLPATTKGDMYWIVNVDSADMLYIYPASGEYMNGVQNSPYVLSFTSAVLIICYSDGLNMAV